MELSKWPYFFLPAASQMVVADLSEPEKRADALSKLGLCFGIGMITGSTLGGHLSTRYGWTWLYICDVLSSWWKICRHNAWSIIPDYCKSIMSNRFFIFPREKFTACFGAAGNALSLLLVLKFIPKNTKVQAPAANTNSKTHIFSTYQW